MQPYESEITKFIKVHGDGVKEVAFQVKDAAGMWKKAVSRGAVSVQEPTTLQDKDGRLIIAKILGYKTDCVITLVDRTSYTGIFMPGFTVWARQDPINKNLPGSTLSFIDHVVQNYPEGDMVPTVEWFVKHLDFHRFWSVDDKQVHTEFSSLKSFVITDFDERIKLPINEPAKGKRVSQIQE